MLPTSLHAISGDAFAGSQADLEGAADNLFYCVNTSYPMDNMLNRSAQTGPPNARKRRPVFPPAGQSEVLCTPQMAPRTSFLSRQPDVIAYFSFGACTVQTCFQHLQSFQRKVCIMTDFTLFWEYI